MYFLFSYHSFSFFFVPPSRPFSLQQMRMEWIHFNKWIHSILIPLLLNWFHPQKNKQTKSFSTHWPSDDNSIIKNKIKTKLCIECVCVWERYKKGKQNKKRLQKNSRSLFLWKHPMHNPFFLARPSISSLLSFTSFVKRMKDKK